MYLQKCRLLRKLLNTVFNYYYELLRLVLLVAFVALYLYTYYDIQKCHYTAPSFAAIIPLLNCSLKYTECVDCFRKYIEGLLRAINQFEQNARTYYMLLTAATTEFLDLANKRVVLGKKILDSINLNFG